MTYEDIAQWMRSHGIKLFALSLVEDAGESTSYVYSVTRDNQIDRISIRQDSANSGAGIIEGEPHANS